MIAIVFKIAPKIFNPLSAIWSIILTLEILAAVSAHAFVTRTKLPHIAVITVATPGYVLPQIRGFYAGLEEAGYVEGKQIVFHKIQVASEARLRTALKETLRGQRVDTIVAPSTIEALIAKEITAKIPIVFMSARDPVRVGFVASLARPGANLTGLSFSRDIEDSAKQLAVFKEIVPSMRRVLLLYHREQIETVIINSVKRVAAKIKLDLAWQPIRSVEDAKKAIGMASKRTTDGVSIICSAIVRGLKPLVDIALTRGLPLFGCAANQVADDGALMTYAPDIYYIGYRGAWYVDTILKGAKPQELPVEVPSKFELIINLKTAKALGLKIPPAKLVLADKVFQ